jgi:hypothetical protein
LNDCFSSGKIEKLASPNLQLTCEADFSFFDHMIRSNVAQQDIDDSSSLEEEEIRFAAVKA